MARTLIAAASVPSVLTLGSDARPSRDACVALLCTYAAVCVVALATSARTGPAARTFHASLPALDVLIFTSLVVASGAYRVPLLVGFLFAVVGFARDAGAKSGVGVAAFVAACVTSVRFDPAAAAVSGQNLSVFAESLTVFALGSGLALWASPEAWRRRFARFESAVGDTARRACDVEVVARSLADRARELFDADRSIFVLADAESSRVAVYRTGRGDEGRTDAAEIIGAELAARLLLGTSSHALTYEGALPWASRARGAVYDASTKRPARAHAHDLAALAGLLDAGAFLSVPVGSRSGSHGRLYVAWSKPHRIRAEDLFALVGTLGVASAAVDEIRGVERVEAAAAERERVRIARDLHDTTIQSFVGLQIGLTAVKRKLDAGSSEIAGDLAKLLALAEIEIGDARGYVEGLRTGDDGLPGLLPSVLRFAGKFRDATGIDVVVRADDDVEVDERLAREVFRLVAEALSNVRRHTRSRRVAVEMRRRDAFFDLRIIDDASDGTPTRPFTPRSIGERTAALGGDLRVSTLKDGSTCIRVTVPLSLRVRSAS